MPAVIRSLHEIQRNSITKEITGRTIVYPETIISAVHMLDGKRTLEAELGELKDESSVTEFNNDGSITETMTNTGMIITTVFNSDGSITETCEYPDRSTYYTKTTTFNADGSITVDKVYAGG